MQAGDGIIGHYRPQEDERRGAGRRRADTETVERLAVVETKLDGLEADTAALRGDVARLEAEVKESLVRVHERIDDLSLSINRQMQHAEKVMGDMLGRHEKAEGAVVDAKIAAAVHPINVAVKRIEEIQIHHNAVVDGIAEDISSIKELGAATIKWAARAAITIAGLGVAGTGYVVVWYVSNYDWITRLVDGLKKMAGEG